MLHESLIDQSVTVHVDAKREYIGIVRKVGKNYILLDDETIGFIVLPLEHVKQLKVSGKMFIAEQDQKNTADINALPDLLTDVLKHFRNHVVQIEGGGPYPTVGYLFDSKGDYLTVCVIPDGFVYFPVKHVLSVLALDVEIQPEFEQWIQDETPKLAQAECFLDMLKNETGKLVKLGRNGPGTIAGIVKNANEIYIELVTSPYESIWIPTHHIKAMTRNWTLDWDEGNSSS